MSIYGVQSRISDIQMVVPQAASELARTADFGAMLSSAISETGSPRQGASTTGTQAVQTDDAANHIQPQSPAAYGGLTIKSAQSQIGSLTVKSAWSIAPKQEPQYVHPDGTPEVGSAWSGTTELWTGNVDTSDGMLEKAAPYMDIIRDASSIYNVPVNVIMAVIKAESDYNPKCRSGAGAMGLMQIMPVNAEYFGVTDPYNPRQNIMCGTEEISRHLNSYHGDLKLALAAYNTGAGNVARRGVTSSSSKEYNRIPASVRAYADRVMRYAGLAS